MRDFDKMQMKKAHPYAWLWERLEDEPSFILRSMFGARAAYLDGKLHLCFMAKTEPWRGVLVCTAREQQQSLVKEFPSLVPHAVLSKWLYLPETAEDFESTAGKLVTLVLRRDGRIGVEGSPKKKKTSGRRTG